MLFRSAAIPGAPAPQGGKPQGNAPQTLGAQAQGQAPSGAQKPGANPAQNVQSQQPNGQKQQVQGLPVFSHYAKTRWRCAKRALARRTDAPL